MSIFVRTDHKSNLLRVEVEGGHTDYQELSDIQVIIDYLVDNPGMNLLCDRRRQTRPHDPAFSLKVAALIGSRIHEMGRRKFAYVIDEKYAHRLDRRFCPVLEEHGIDVRIYNEPGSALRWLSSSRRRKAYRGRGRDVTGHSLRR